METKDFIINGVEYTLVDVYKTKIGMIIQLNSDDCIKLFLADKDYNIRNLSPQDEWEFRKEHGMIDTGFIAATPRDLLNLDFHAKKVPKELQKLFKARFMEKLAEIDINLQDSPYIKRRLKALQYRVNASGNYYGMNTVYFIGDFPEGELPEYFDSWILFHETVHGIVNYSVPPSRAMIESITDKMVGRLLPQGNYSKNCPIVGGEILINDTNMGLDHLAPFANQLEFGLGDSFDLYEMLTRPHRQIRKFGAIYGRGKSRVLLHKINKLYFNVNFENFMDAQDYMLNMIFNKKIESVTDSDSAQKFFEELIQFGLLRGRVNNRDSKLKIYYLNAIEYLKQKGIDVSKVPPYRELEFYPKGNVYFLFDEHIENCEAAIEAGEVKSFMILYNKDNTSVYIIVDGKLYYVRHDSQLNTKGYWYQGFDKLKDAKVIQIGEDRYSITIPNGITEEARVAYVRDELENEEKIGK